MARSLRSLKRAALVVGIAAMVGGACEMTGFAAATDSLQGNSQKAKAAKDKNKAKDNKAKDNKGPKANKGSDSTVVVVVDRDGHRRIVREYVTRGLPPGLAKRRQLPPGLAGQLRENGALPPGLREYFVVVPADWNGRLQPLPPYYSRYFVGRDLIIVDTRSDRLVSLIRDLLD